MLPSRARMTTRVVVALLPPTATYRIFPPGAATPCPPTVTPGSGPAANAAGAVQSPRAREARRRRITGRTPVAADGFLDLDQNRVALPSARTYGGKADPAAVAAARELLARHDHATGAVVHAGRVPGGRRPLRVEDGLERREPLERGVASRPLVDGEVADRDDLVREAPLVDRADGALVRAERPAVLVLARDAELARHLRGLLHHVQLVEGRGEAVEDHRVDELAVPEPVAEPRLLQQVGRVRHRLHAARDDQLVVAGADHLVGDLDCADRRRADLVDRVGADLDRDPRADRRLARRGLARSRLEHLAHDHVLDLVGPEPGP